MSLRLRSLGSIAGSPAEPAELRALLQSLGPPFVKLGQYLSLRPDLVREDICNELLRLTDDAPAFDWDVARRIIEDDLGGPIASKFDRIDPVPVAAASLAQVHRARTLDGAMVAVKVQRPDAAESCRRAFKRERLLERVLGATEATAVVPAAEVVQELQRWITTELDMTIELSNLTRMHALTRGSVVARVPRPYPALSGRRVITAEFMTGVPFSELLRVVRAGREGASIADLGFSPLRLAENLIEAVFAQVFEYQFFHADPHPGNLIAMPGNVVGFVDLALTDSLTPSYRRVTSDFLTAIYNDDVDGMARSMIDVLIRGDRSDVERFRRELIEKTGLMMRDRADGGARSTLRQYMVGVVAIARDCGLRVPTGLLAMYRAFLTAETIAEQLGGDVDIASVGKAFFKRYHCDQALSSLDTNRIMALGLDVLNLVKTGPGQVHRLLSDLADDKLVISVRTSESPADARDATARVKLLATSGVAISLAVLVAGVGSRTIAGVALAVVLWPLLGLIYLWMVVLWRRMS